MDAPAPIPPADAPQPAPSPAVAPPLPTAVVNAWPRSAQLTTAFLLGICVTLLAVHAWNSLRWTSKPSDLDRSTVLTYRIDLNRAERAELLQLPGVGPNLAERIEDHRRQHGGFRNVDDLIQVHGVGPATLARLRPWVTVQLDESEEQAVEPAAPVVVKKPTTTMASGKKEAAGVVDINRATLEELQKLPGIGPKMAQRIVDERTKKPFQTVNDLRRVSGIGPKTLDKLRPFVRVSSASATVAAAE